MKGPNPRCPECGAHLTYRKKWIEDVGYIEEWYCPSCEWEEE